ncbi:MAG: SDR family NAD(P)-dependent oxidoreductase [Lachnospiraceae bacterium]|nr:SDR family NAD(P)-dependent oxidoreductase [Lachnospiraceae bacterium]
MTEHSIRTALVTGADRGLGYEMTVRLLDEGFRVYAGKFNDEYSLLDRLAEEYPELRPVQLNVSVYEEIVNVEKIIREECGYLDLLVSNAAFMGGPQNDQVGGDVPIDFDLMRFSFNTNTAPAPVLVDVFLPLLLKSDYRRLHFTSSEISSVRLMKRTGSMRYAMTKSALNVGVRLMFNELRPLGFRFRLFQPGWMKRMMPDGTLDPRARLDPKQSAEMAVKLILEDRPDEDRLTLVDYLGHELSF